MFKNIFSIVTVCLLLGIGLAGSAFASGTGSSELDADDYVDGHVVSNQQVDRSYRPEVEQNAISVSAFVNGTGSNELDADDYADGNVISYQQVDRSYRPEVEQNAISSSVFASGTGSSELDADDYVERTSSIKDSKDLHCAEHSGSGAVAQMKDCG